MTFEGPFSPVLSHPELESTVPTPTGSFPAAPRWLEAFLGRAHPRCPAPAPLQGAYAAAVGQSGAAFCPAGCSPGRPCCRLVISQLNTSQGWSHHLVWFKVKLPEWDGRD